MPNHYLEKIRQAEVYAVAIKTPLENAPKLSHRLGNEVYFKREDLQQVFSFKLRGAYNKMYQLTPEQREQGVIAASAGNHAQGVALAAQKLAINAVIVMPKTTPDIKVKSVSELGGEVILHGNTYDDACQYAEKLAVQQNRVFVHPYDDPDVIAGQGTVAMELLEQLDCIDMIFVPVGGGGLIAGISAYIKEIKPDIKVIGVEPDDAACMAAAMRAGQRVKLDQIGIFADGVAVRQVGEEPFRIAQQCVDEVVTVSTDEICAAIKDIFDEQRTICEPAGALAVAGIKKYLTEHTLNNKHIVAINSGANINFDRLRHVAERAEIGEQREALFAVTIPETPGSFKSFCGIVGKRGITEFNYRYSDPGEAHIFVGVQLQNGEQEKQQILQTLHDNNYPVVDMSDNEMAKLHVRYMVGGRCDSIRDEQLYRFQFPERPGALLRFLQHMGKHWNISLFHYRNHGAAYGRILVGIQVPEDDESAFKEFLQNIQYPSWDESKNPAYNLFLR